MSGFAWSDNLILSLWFHGPKRNLAGVRAAVTITVTVGHFQLPIDREYSLSPSSSSSITFSALQASSRQHPLPVHHISRLIPNPNALHPTLSHPARRPKRSELSPRTDPLRAITILYPPHIFLFSSLGGEHPTTSHHEQHQEDIPRTLRHAALQPFTSPAIATGSRIAVDALSSTLG